MKDVLQVLRSKVHVRRVTSELMQIAAVSVLIGISAYVFSIETSLAPFLLGGMFFVTSIAIAFITGRFAKPPMQEIIRYLDRNYPIVEESAYLLQKDVMGTTLESWQKQKIADRLKKNVKQISLPNNQLKKATMMSGLWLSVSLLLVVFKPILNKQMNSLGTQNEVAGENIISEKKESIFPEIIDVQIKVSPPSYTNLSQKVYSFEEQNLLVPEQSEVEWAVTVKGHLNKAQLLFSDGERLALESTNQSKRYTGRIKTEENHIYQIQLMASDTTISSAFRSIEAKEDQPPGFVIQQPTEKRDFVTPQNKNFEIEATIGDDYAITSALIKATLARGSGENVRFREQDILFTELSGMGSNEVEASTTLNADSLEMEPGDELYFYITATDNRPNPQTARSDTYFIVYADSGEATTVEVAGFGVDLLPEYFRSQRQIIIDTEQLLEDEPDITQEEFNRRSEKIGYDQNLLRLRYGEYLGLEDEMTSTEESNSNPGNVADAINPNEAEEDHDHGKEELNEMGLTNAESDAAEDIPDEFFHDHGAAEMNTLYAQSPRAMLKEALDNMWNSEMYLRTQRPQEALPFEYAALELLKAVQQANRQYTRKAGYDLPPIPVEEKRFSRNYDDFADPRSMLDTNRPQNPLVEIQLLLEDQTWSASEIAEEGRSLISSAQLDDANRLYLLNRFRTIENEGRNNEIEQEIITLLKQVANDVQIDPAPVKKPVIPKSQSRP